MDYTRIAKVSDRLEELRHKLRGDNYYFSDEVRALEKQLGKLIVGEIMEVEGKFCREAQCYQYSRHGRVYYPGKIHHLDGDTRNESLTNLAMVCPNCNAHILLSHFTIEDVWLLKARGLSYGEIGRLMNLSRQRIQQVCQKYEAKQKAELNALMQADLNDLVKKAERMENYLIASGRLKRRIDRRTKKKRIIAELNKFRAKEAQK